ncbi:hypothetical protein NHQ30_007915 [Ciborinia camelliae]|nr:hypothetical protein NHQ30_007915 [Ciborinia camelliae]
MEQQEVFEWIKENPNLPQQPTPTQKQYRPRKSHTKSRNGCNNCRKRRIKCDEVRPSCGQCSERLLGALQCDFSVPPKPTAEGSLPAKLSIGTISNTSARDQIISELEQSGVLTQHSKDSVYKSDDALELLNHFLDCTSPWIGTTAFQRILQQHGLELSLNAPYLMHAILAFSARHLIYLRPEEKKYNIAFALHYALSLSSYSLQLRTIFDASNADASLASSYLHTMLAFKNVQPQNHSTVDVDAAGGLTWLRAMRGVTVLWSMSDIRSHQKNSLFLGLDNHCKQVAEGEAPDLDDVLPALNSWALETSRAIRGLFEVDCDPDTFKNSYEGPLNNLYQLMRLGNDRDVICRFMSFVGELPDSFVELLDQKEPRALLMLCYWSALLTQHESWWVGGPAKVVCKRLCSYLDGILDQRVHDLLQFPASNCGYTMEDSRRTTAEALLQLQNGITFL